MRTKPVDLRSLYRDSIPKTNYSTHGFDNYPAKMIPHMARFLIEKVSKPGQTILDPFCGSGAVLVEASVCGRNAIGVDLNPWAVLLSRAKTGTYDSNLLEAQLDEILYKCKSRKHDGVEYDFTNASYWFTPVTLRKFGVIKAVMDEYLPQLENGYPFFWQAALTSIVRACSKADTRGPKPFISKKARAERSGRHFDPFKLLAAKARSLIKLHEDYLDRLRKNGGKPSINIIEGDSKNLLNLLNGTKVDSVVTSPPYVNAQDYYRSSKLQLFILQHSSPDELREFFRGITGSDGIFQDDSILNVQLPSPLAGFKKTKLKPKQACVFAKYVLDMYEVLGEINKVLRVGSYSAIVSGHNLISGSKIPTPKVIIELASEAGFKLTDHCRDRIRERWVPTVRNGHNGVIDEEHLLIFKKTKDYSSPLVN